MRTIARIFILITAALALVVITAFLTGCADWEALDENMQILRRIPKGNVLIISAKPAEIFNSQFLHSLSIKNDEMDKIRKAGQKFCDQTGINPAEDIDRIVIMSKDLKEFEKNWSAIVQGNMKMFFLDSLLAEKDVRDSLLVINGFTVHYITVAKKVDFPKFFIYFDENEIMLTSGEKNMENMLVLKRKGGESLADNTSFIRRFRSLKYSKHAWCVMSVKGLIEDVLEKVRKKRPDLQINMVDISNIQGGMHLDNELGLCLEAVCPNREQVRLLLDTVHGFLALGKLTIGSLPQIRNILDNVEIENYDDLLKINVSLSLRDILALRTLEH